MKPHLTPEHFRQWMQIYGAASQANDARASAKLFTLDAQYFENPFDEPLAGRDAIFEYWNKGAQNLQDKVSAFEILAVQNNCGIARWQSQFTVMASGKRCALDCLFVVEFAPDGLCQIFREWWHMREITNG